MNTDLRSDLTTILNDSAELWEELRGSRILITGGTGFFGCWILESLMAANSRFRLNVSVTVLTRNPGRFSAKAPHLTAHPDITVLAGDVRDFTTPDTEFNFIIHAATEASAKLAAESPMEMFSTIVDGTRRVLEVARESRTSKLLLTSSGAVYGQQPPGISHVTEYCWNSPDSLDPKFVYGNGKRAAEHLCALYASQFALKCKIARCFAFVGPHLPLDTHFAIGNFIKDALSGGPIRVGGDGTPRRSYLYAADLAIWLWTILLRGESCRPYNVGSESDLSIAELAGTVARVVAPGAEIQIARQPVPGVEPERYVPCTKRAQVELNLKQRFLLDEAIQRTAEWYRIRPTVQDRPHSTR